MNGKLWCVATLAAVVIWSIVASFVWCYYSDICEAGEWWLLQWWFEVHYWNSDNWYTKALLVGSGVAASVAAGLFLFGLRVSTRRNKRQPNLWGSTDFANRAEMREGGIKAKRKLF